jgi:hypothetical protein
VGFADRYIHALNASNLKDDERHHQAEPLTAAAFAAAGLTGDLGLLLHRVKFGDAAVRSDFEGNPGVGPENPVIPLSARGKLHLQLAARRFAQGDVAFIITSGAAVHPKGSRFVEAVEMRKALVERYHIPADRIVIEPYARHTTTNLRNATRRLHAMGAPLDKPTLIVANADQSRYITSPEFAARNPAELGYDPGTIGTRHSPYEVEFLPSLHSLRVDPWDPLDP